MIFYILSYFEHEQPNKKIYLNALISKCVSAPSCSELKCGGCMYYDNSNRLSCVEYEELENEAKKYRQQNEYRKSVVETIDEGFCINDVKGVDCSEGNQGLKLLNFGL